MIVIGASLGGLRALGTIFSSLPAGFRRPIAVVLHRAKDSPDLLTSVLQGRTSLRLIEVVDKDPIEESCIYFAPPDYHLLVDHGSFSLSIEAPVHYARPSIDVLFESAANLLGAGVVAVVLTGSSADGAAGAAAVVARGGTVVVQDPSTAEAPTMPMAALRLVPNARLATLAEIGPLLHELSLQRS